MRPLNSLRRFVRDESGSVTLESLLMFPLLVWVLLATAVFFQAFHAISLNTKVSYTIGDILSREDRPITPAYMDSLHRLQIAMTGRQDERLLRVTAVTYDEDDDAYRVIWSRTRGDAAQHTDASLESVRSRIPVLGDGQITILTETSVRHIPAFVRWIGFEPFEFEEIMATRPRGAQFCWNDSDNPANWTAATTVCQL